MELIGRLREKMVQTLDTQPDASVKVIIKTIKTHSETEMWISDKVPFGLVETTSKTTVNGKAETGSSRIIAAGMSGAKSEIDESTASNPFDALQNPGNE